MDNLNDVVNYLQNVKIRNSLDTKDYAQAKKILSTQKLLAQENENETLANHIWCLEKTLEIQYGYAQAFSKIKKEEYYKGWCDLETVEIKICALERHFDIYTNEFYLASILRYVEQFQSAYPYSLFLSPGFIHKKKSCSICGQQISIRNPCGHIKGHIYNGEMCVHRIEKAELLEMSIVENPVQKYSVPFINDENGNTIDHHDYSRVAYYAAGLRRPFDDWMLEHIYIRESHDFYRDIGRNDKCPCGSGKKYKKCCLKESGVLVKHIRIITEVPPPSNVPQYLATKESFPFREQKSPLQQADETFNQESNR